MELRCSWDYYRIDRNVKHYKDKQMTAKESARYEELIDKALVKPLTKREEDEINRLGKKSVEARKRNNSNK